MKNLKTFILLLICSTLIISCSSEDSDNGNTCGNFINQDAQGNFKGTDFTYKGGTYSALGGNYLCKIFISELTGGSCNFPTFGGNEGVILFNLSSLENQTITLSDTVNQGSILNTLNFNSNSGNVTDAELATCGTIEITSKTDSTISGRIVANGQQNSTINGNFTLTLCD